MTKPIFDSTAPSDSPGWPLPGLAPALTFYPQTVSGDRRIPQEPSEAIAWNERQAQERGEDVWMPHWPSGRFDETPVWYLHNLANRAVALSPGRPPLVVFDAEGANIVYGDDTLDELLAYHRRWMRVIDQMRVAQPGLVLGAYPHPQGWEHDHKREVGIQSLASVLYNRDIDTGQWTDDGFTDHLHAMNPDMYAPRNADLNSVADSIERNHEGWDACHKPVYPFIWHRHWAEDGRAMSVDQWRTYIRTLLDHPSIDGLVWWAKPGEPWSEAKPYYEALTTLPSEGA